MTIVARGLGLQPGTGPGMVVNDGISMTIQDIPHVTLYSETGIEVQLDSDLSAHVNIDAVDTEIQDYVSAAVADTSIEVVVE
jgi:hypothetical protein